MEGKTIIITGASDGIGAQAARQLHSQGASIVLVGRSSEKTKKIAKELEVPYYLADFARLDDVRRLASLLQRDYEHIDVLLNNAGGIFGKRELTVDGHEKTWQVDYLAPFLLTNLLLDTLINSKAAVINVSSLANEMGNIDIRDLELERNFSANRAYGNAKLGNILFTKELHRRYHKQGISTVAVHPGGIATNFANNTTSIFCFVYRTPLALLLARPLQGALPLIWLAQATPGRDWQSGDYYNKMKVGRPSRQALDATLAHDLWEVSAASTLYQPQQ